MKFSNKILFRQEGGPMPAEDSAMAEGAPAPEQGNEPAAPAQASPEEMASQIAQQLVEMLMQQIGDPQMVMLVLQAAQEMVSQAMGGQPEAPVYQKQGGRLVRVKR